ncbi:Uncharacterized protein pbN1_19100 [Aromatoleum bremense]|nr:Uncharacterized protein pbN1_19100 [Aromatoleum bremense]
MTRNPAVAQGCRTAEGVTAPAGTSRQARPGRSIAVSRAIKHQGGDT